MPPLASKPRASRICGRSVRMAFRASLHLTGILHDKHVAFVVTVALRRDCTYSLPPVNRAARATMEKLQERDKDTTTARVLNYRDAFEHLEPVLHSLTPDHIDAIIRLTWRLETRCMTTSALRKVPVKIFGLISSLRSDPPHFKQGLRASRTSSVVFYGLVSPMSTVVETILVLNR